MARAGDVLENPSTGDRLVFRKTAAETGGEVLEYEIDFVPRGVAARDHFHPLPDSVRARFQSRPALASEVLLETLFGLARSGKVNGRGDPSLLQLAVIFRDFGGLGHITKPPLAVRRALFGPLAALGRLRGHRGRYPEYSGAV